MNILYGLPYKDRHGNDIYTDFRNMLQLEQIVRDEKLKEEEKALISLRLLYGDELPDTITITQAFEEVLWFFHQGKEIEQPKGTIKQLFDFEEDSAYFLASFLSSYNINLSDTSKSIHWWQFMNLFIALPEDTQLMQRIGIRGVDTSKLKGDQKKYYEERKKAVELKSSNPNTGLSLEEIRINKQKKIDKMYEEAKKNKK